MLAVVVVARRHQPGRRERASAPRATATARRPWPTRDVDSVLHGVAHDRAGGAGDRRLPGERDGGVGQRPGRAAGRGEQARCASLDTQALTAGPPHQAGRAGAGPAHAVQKALAGESVGGRSAAAERRRRRRASGRRSGSGAPRRTRPACRPPRRHPGAWAQATASCSAPRSPTAQLAADATGGARRGTAGRRRARRRPPPCWSTRPRCAPRSPRPAPAGGTDPGTTTSDTPDVTVCQQAITAVGDAAERGGP